MNKSEIKENINIIKKLYETENFDEAYEKSKSLVETLFHEKKYMEIIDADQQLESVPLIFEVAYSYDIIGNSKKAEEIYETILSFENNNSAILNNLSNIKKNNGEIKLAFELIKKAYRINPADKIIKNNYGNLNKIIEAENNKNNLFKSSLENLKKETEWAISKLLKFIDNVKKESSYVDGTVAIPQWKFKVLMSTDDSKAKSLKDQWIQKWYILATGNRDLNMANIYEINPYLESALNKIKPIKLNQQWFDGFNNINQETLTSIDYFNLATLIQKVNKKYQLLMQRDFDELIFNYLTKNKKSTIILAGSFIELLFTYYCEKKKSKTSNIPLQKTKRQK